MRLNACPPMSYNTPSFDRSLLVWASTFSCRSQAILLRAMNAMSYPFQGAPSSLAISLITRLQRFLIGAHPSFFPAMNAQRPCNASSRRSTRTVINDEEERLPVWKRRSTSSLLLMVPFIGSQTLSCEADESQLDSQALATLGTTCLENVATSTGCHARTEAVALSTLALVGLVCTFHRVSS